MQNDKISFCDISASQKLHEDIYGKKSVRVHAG